eukprot:scaffold2044_cov202-Prasinococcus_capsulatus_cf.AAC.11
MEAFRVTWSTCHPRARWMFTHTLAPDSFATLIWTPVGWASCRTQPTCRWRRGVSLPHFGHIKKCSSFHAIEFLYHDCAPQRGHTSMIDRSSPVYSSDSISESSST